MTTLSITSLDRNTQSRKARAPQRAIAVLVFGVAWYGALLVAAVLPAQASAAPVAGHAAQASVKDTAVTHRVPGTCTPLRCR